MIGFNLYNLCDIRTDDGTKPIMINSCDTGQNRCHMTAAATPIIDNDGTVAVAYQSPGVPVTVLLSIALCQCFLDQLNCMCIAT